MIADRITEYKTETNKLLELKLKLEKKIKTISALRLSCFLIALICFFIFIERNGWISTAILIGGIILFIPLLLQSHTLKKKLKETNLRLLLTENEIANVEEFANCYPDGSLYIDKSHDYTYDLDIFGPHSLFAYINRCSSFAGNKKLASWLSNRADNTTIAMRQEAIKELANKNIWCREFQLGLFEGIAEYNTDFAVRINKIEKKICSLSLGKLLQNYVKTTHILTLVLVAISIGLGFSIGTTMFVAYMAFNFFIIRKYADDINKIHFYSDKLSQALNRFSGALGQLESTPFNSVLLSKLKTELTSNNNSPSKTLSALSKIIEKMDFRLGMLTGPIMNGFFCWDLFIVLKLQKWVINNQENINHYIDAIGEMEAVISLAKLHYNHPNWAFPSINNSYYKMTAMAIGHPLIHQNKRVNNDFEIGTDTKGIIITGSNMAGKSTFLRTIAVNKVLALCGSCTCAKQLDISNTPMITYMRIVDSLEEGLSTFGAEIKRLQKIIEKINENKRYFLLIDEMLRGTNSHDKHKGSEAFILHMIKTNHKGIIATHDTQLCSLASDYPNSIKNYYFDMALQNDNMYFDYHIKVGVSKNRNASYLLKQIGVEIEPDDTEIIAKK